MTSWRKLLSQMVAVPHAQSYTYEDAARVLRNLGFEPARSKPKGSHRVWRKEVVVEGVKRAVYIGLVDKGHGNIKSVYIKEMLRILETHSLIPEQD